MGIAKLLVEMMSSVAHVVLFLFEHQVRTSPSFSCFSILFFTHFGPMLYSIYSI